MEIFSLLGASALLPLFVGFLWLPVLAYLVARWRSYRESTPADPQLGLKTALKFFSVLASQFALAGGFLLVFTVLQEGSGGRGDSARAAFGVLVPSLLVYGAHFVALARTNLVEQPLVGRLFDGAMFIQVGLVGFIALVAAFVFLLQKGDTGNAGRAAWSAVLVYVPAWAALGWRLLQKSGLGGPAGMGGLGRAPTGGAPPPGAVPLPPPAVPLPPPAVPPPGGGYPPR